MSLRYHDPHIKSLLHFNFPHYLESGDALADDIGIFSWTRSGNAELLGSEYPPPDAMSGCPKFGYRCLRTSSNSDYILGTGDTQSFPKLEASMWIRDGSSSNSNIMLLKNGDSTVLSLTHNADRKFVLTCSTIGLTLTSHESLQTNTWIFLRVQVSPSGANISVNNSAGTSATLSASSLPQFNKIQLGGLYGEIDEFTLRNDFTSGLPGEPTKGNLDVNALGGFGAGSLGNVTLNANCIMNTAGYMSGENKDNRTTWLVEAIQTGKFGTFKTGDEVLILEHGSHAFCFRTITKMADSTYGYYLTFNSKPASPSTGRDISPASVIQIPHFNSLTVNSGVTVSPSSEVIPAHGIIAFRVKNDCTINGSLITSGKGSPRHEPSYDQSRYYAGSMHHSKLPDYFLFGEGGGVFMACGGTLTASSSARIGASWSGAGTGGAANGGINSGGGAGYGGGSSTSAGISGNVGWGGYSKYSPQIGSMPGRNSLIPLANIYTSYTESTANHPYSGASVIIIAKRIRIDENAISTGGENAPQNSSPEVSGAGAGFCYIACKEAL